MNRKPLAHKLVLLFTALGVVALLLLPVLLFAQDALPAAPTDQLPVNLDDFGPLIALLKGKWAWLVVVFAWMGALRAGAKPFGVILQNGMSKLIGSEPETARKLVAHPIYRTFAFFLDWVASIKLPDKASVAKLLPMVLLALMCLPLSACIVSKTRVHQLPHLLYGTNGTPVVGMETEATVYSAAAGNGNQQVGNLTAGATKTTVKAGASGIEQEAKGAEALGEMNGMLDRLIILRTGQTAPASTNR